jgi:diguanylate cyclase (GGDEF)-like protein/PAS domain S-box-containing protein
MVADAAEFAGHIVAPSLGVPSVMKGFGALLPKVRVAGAAQEVEALWASRGLEPRRYGGAYDHLYIDIYPALFRRIDRTPPPKGKCRAMEAEPGSAVGEVSADMGGAVGVDLSVDGLLARLYERACRCRAGEWVPDLVSDGDEAAAAERLGFLGVLLRRSLDGVALTARQSRWFVEVSDSFEALSGYSRRELLGRTSTELALVPDDEVRSYVTGRADQAVEGRYETRLRRKDGELRWVEFSHQLIARNDYVLTIVRDTTERRRMEDDLRLLADTDPLTGIFNRRRFEDEVERRIRESQRFGDALTLLVIDVDGLKSINDRHGHHIGDEVLCAVGGALRAAVRETDIIGRLGGDEFVALLIRASRDGAERVAKDFLRCLQAEKVSSAAELVPINASVGIATLDSQHSDYQLLMRAADQAMYARKMNKPANPHAR